MRKAIVILLSFFTMIINAQNIAVKSFELDEKDVTANLQGTTVFDQNGEKCALIKIYTTATGFTFDVGSMGVQKVEQKTGEIWVYVPYGVKRISMNHQQLGHCEYSFPVSISRARTYKMELVAGEVQTIVKNAITSQYVMFKVTSPKGSIEINNQLIDIVDGGASVRLPFGTYDYRVQASGYYPQSGKVTVNNPKEKHIVTVNLEPAFSTVTIKVDADAEIWVNDEKKGFRSFTGALPYGTYLMECRQQGYRTSQKEITLSKANAGQTIILPSPIPIYGSVDINSTPVDATIFIDEKRVGTTPMFIPELLIGEHNIRISKTGYKDYTASTTISEGKTNEVRITLKNMPKVNDAAKEQAATMSDGERAKAYDHLVGVSIEKNSKERAKAYDHLVGMCIADNSKERDKALTAEKPEVRKSRTYMQYNAAYDAVKNAQLCNEADNEPNEKGQVKPQFKKKNASRVQAMRNDLVNGGLWAYNNKDYVNAEKWFGMFAESHSNDLFSDTKEVTEEINFGQVAYYAALAAFMNKSYKNADKYAGYAIESGDAEVKPDAIKIQLNSYQARKDAGEIDGEYLLKKIKQVYEANPDNDIVFGKYIGVLIDNGKKEEADKVLTKRLQENPNDVMANAYVAQNAQEAGEYNKAIDAYSKVLVAQPDFTAVKYNLATCYRNKALDLKNNNQPYKELLQKAKAIFQEVQTADPDEKDYKTKYILRTIDSL